MLDTIKQVLGIGPKVDYASLVKEGAIILDVRSRSEYQGGHIKGSIHISLDTLNANIDKLKNKNTPIITCCASGMRSGSAKSFLKSRGYQEVHNGGNWQRLKSKI